MRTQAIFRRVIRAGHYATQREGSQYMCHALRHAQEAGTISEQQHRQAARAITKYQDHLRSIGGGPWSVLSTLMSNALGVPGGPGEQEQWAASTGKRLYWDWDKRPMAKN